MKTRFDGSTRARRSFRLLLFAIFAIVLGGCFPSFAQDHVRTEMIEAFEAYALQKMGHHDRAFTAWMALAEKGNARGILHVANAYQEGKGVEQDPAEAVRWYRKGAEQGDPHCLYNLARAYEAGHGVDADQVKADAYFKLAASAGSTDAQLILARGLLDENKDGEARYWLERAAGNGDQDAARLLSRLTPSAEPEAALSLTVDQQRRIIRLLDDLDAAANERDADLLTGTIEENAEISVRLPGQSSPQIMTKPEYRALWAATFEKAERYRFARTKFDKENSGDGVRLKSRIREYFTSGTHTRVLVLHEELTVSFNGPAPRVTKVLLRVEEEP